jgi:phage shock protein E
MSVNLKLACVVAIATVVSGSIYGCENHDDVITPSVLIARIESGSAPVVLDVRTAEEYAAGHIPGAINISHTELSGRLWELEAHKNDEIVVHCGRGGRASFAEEILLEKGFSDVRDLEGHMAKWQENGYPTEQD